MTVTRRSVLIASTAAPTAASLLSSSAAHAAPTGAALPPHGPLRDGWRFALVNPGGTTDPSGAYAEAAAPDYDDSAWRRVAVPHDWSIEQTPPRRTAPPAAPASSPAASAGTGSPSPCRPPSRGSGSRSSSTASTWTRTSTATAPGPARHPYGYTGFALDLTDLVHTDGTTENVIAVKVQNQLPSSRWYSGSGIYREARLVLTEPVHLERWGTYVTTPDVTADRAVVQVRTAVLNESGTPGEVEVSSRVVDPGGRTVARTNSTVSVTGRSTEDHELTVRKPKLWDIDTPDHRYTLETELRVAGKTVDTYSTPFGIRTYRFDPDEGFSLNGTPPRSRASTSTTTRARSAPRSASTPCAASWPS